MGKGGRPRKNGERYPSGDVKPTVEGIAPALWQRIRADGMAKLLDPRFGSELGRLNMRAELTNAQTATGMRIGEIYGRFERYKRKPRSAKSPSYEMGFGGEPDIAEERMTSEEIAQHEDRVRAATTAWQDLQAKFPNSAARSIIEMLCVEDRPVPSHHLGDLRKLLDFIAAGFGAKWKAAKATSALRTKVPEAVKTAPGGELVRQRDSSLTALELVLRRVAPKLDPDGLKLCEQTFIVLRAREEFRRVKPAK